MDAKTPASVIKLLDDAFDSGDLDGVLRYYEEVAVVLPQPGIEARGTERLRELYSSFMKPGTTAKQIKTHVVEADGIALFTSRWSLNVDDQPPQELIATTVFRRQPDGGWKALIDNARGPLILG